MQVSGQFVDSNTGEPVSNVSVQIVDRYGKTTGIGVVGDGEGRFVLNSDLISNDAKYLLYATSTSYEGQLVDPMVFATTDIVTMNRLYEALPEMVIMPKPKVATANSNWIGWAIAGGILLWLFSSSKRSQ